MSKLPIAGILILMLLVVSGYVSSEPTDIVDEGRTQSATQHLDPHVSYYEQHLITAGIVRRAP